MSRPKPSNSSRTRPVNDPLAQQLPLVSGRWLLWSLVGIFGGGLVLVYLTMCLLFWQGQWQILFKPSHTESSWPSSEGIKFENLRFGASETGQPALDGWYLPAPADGRYSGLTLLYLHDMTEGSLSQTVPELDGLHALGTHVFAFDYRGFGFSGFIKPSEKSTTEDTEAAWNYLVETRHIPARSIVLYGEGLGASLAAEAAARHPDAAGLVLDAPSPTAMELLRADPRSHWMPLWLLAHDRFDPGAAFSAVKQPILFLLPPPPQDRPGRRYAERASDPKMIVSLPKTNADSDRLEALRRFLDDLPR
jgi:pimeloyl-ACP methyl ester carboxylesterase